LIAAGHADLLRSVLGTVTIPIAVFNELTHPSVPDAVRNWMLKAPDWLTVHELTTPIPSSLADVLDADESEAIQLALDLGTDFILIDERRGRREAALHGLKTIGALGILLEAHRLGLITEPMQELSQLRSHGFRVSRRLVNEFLRLAGT
jgi:hypothetical protein